MRVFVVRHGETASNRDGRFQGREDERLLEGSRPLARQVGRALRGRGVSFASAWSSPLSRASETALEVLAGCGNEGVRLRLDDRLLEVDMGDWEGLRFRPGERDVDPEQSRLFFEDPFAFRGFPGGEDARAVCHRTQEFLTELCAGGDGNVLVSTHGFALRAMLNPLYDDPSDFWQGGVPLNCTLSVVEVADGDVRLASMDEVLYDSSLCVDRYASY